MTDVSRQPLLRAPRIASPTKPNDDCAGPRAYLEEAGLFQLKLGSLEAAFALGGSRELADPE